MAATLQPYLTSGTGCIVTAFFALCGHKQNEMSRDETKIDQKKIPAGPIDPVHGIEYKDKNHDLRGLCIQIEKPLIGFAVPVCDTRKQFPRVHTAQCRAVLLLIGAAYTTSCLKNIGEHI
jgi:hypothetical protein